MTLHLSRSISLPKPITLLLLFLIVIFPTFAQAIPYLYTYTGNSFTYSTDTLLPTTSRITVSFILDPGSGPGSLLYGTGTGSPIPFDISAGPYNISTASPLFAGSEVVLYWNALGQITQWFIMGNTNLGGLLGGTMDLVTWNYNDPNLTPYAVDQTQIFIPGISLSEPIAYNMNDPGTWSMTPIQCNAPVPEPATFILLGSSLAGLAATRKRKRS